MKLYNEGERTYEDADADANEALWDDCQDEAWRHLGGDRWSDIVLELTEKIYLSALEERRTR